MISEFLLKGIDNIFQDKLAMSRPQGRSVFNRDTIKRDLSSVIRTKQSRLQTGSPSPIKKANLQRNLQNIQQEFNVQPESEEPQPEMTKSRLKTYLENDRQNKLKSVIRKTDARSRTPTKNTPAVNYTEPPQQQPSPYEPRGRPPPVYKYQQHLSYSPAQPQPYNYTQPEEVVQPWQYREREPPRRQLNLHNQYGAQNVSQQEPRRASPSPARVTRPSYNRMF